MTRLVNLDSLPAHPSKTARDETATLRGAAVSIGNFDGVHLGHRSLLTRLSQIATQVDGPSVAVVFDPHPAQILRPAAAPPKLTTLKQRAERMDEVGIDALLVCRTTPDLLQMTAERFFDALIVETLGAKAMIEGPNFFFGKNRAGDVQLLSDRCAGHSIHFEVASVQEDSNGLVSSSRIRTALNDGDLAEVTRMLGRPHQLSGLVVEGARRGRTIGFPTANLTDVSVMLPSPGVYGGIAQLPNGASRIAAIHLGPNPTFEKDGQQKLEIHLVDYSGDLYGDQLTVDFRTRIRDVQSFASADQLSDQLRQDIESISQQVQL